MPKTMPRMTKEGEARLRTALDAVVDLVNDGETPDDAIVKVASEHSFSPGHISLMVAAYNTGRTTRHREGHTSLLDKAADFPIADAPSILERLYPSRVKSAAATERESGVHVAYSMAPTWYTRTTRDAGMEKAAAATDWKLTDQAVAAYPTVRDEEAGERIKIARQKAAQADESDRLEASRIQNQLMNGFAKLAEYFAEPGNLTLADIRENVETVFGKEGVAVINQLRRTRPNLVKAAATGRFHSTMGEPYHTVASLVDLAGRLHQVINGNEKRAADRATALEDLERPFVPARRESLLDPLSSPGTKAANLGMMAGGTMGMPSAGMSPLLAGGAMKGPMPSMGTGGMGLSAGRPMTGAPTMNAGASMGMSAAGGGPVTSVASKMAADGFLPNINELVGSGFIQPTIEQLQPTDKEKLVEKKLNQIATPQHEQQLRDIKTRAMLEDMLTHDPVIKGHDRDEILTAFNEVSQLAPRASQQPLLMNALLRQRLQQGSLDQFQTSDLVKTEQGLRNIGSVPLPPGAKSGPLSSSVLAQ